MRIICLITLFFIITHSAISQITIDNTTYSITQLVNTVLVPAASGTVVSNVNFRGCLNVSNRYQAGYFSTATTTQSDMGFTGGVVLSTGNTADIPLGLGQNPGSAAQMSRNYTSGSAGEIRSSNAPAGTDADANNLISPENYYNAAILEFDFVPVTSYMEFRYVFGSEEYDDASGSAFAINYNCSDYNDKFAFLLSGPGISGGQGYLNDAINIARLNNNSEVGINAVNNGNVGSSGGAPNASNCTAANPLWTNGSSTAEFKGFIDGTELNGNTNILAASYASLTPGMTYHIRLLIADAKDGAYDSVVYLEESSFTTELVGLPIELIEFRGDCFEKGNTFEWSTSSEFNNDYFVIEQTYDGANFVSVDTIKSQGNSSSLSNYYYSYENRLTGVNYFRLSQVDLDGKKVALKTIAISNDCKSNEEQIFANFNHSSNSIEIEFENDFNGQYAFTMFNGLGQISFENSDFIDGARSLKINLPSHVSKGIYYIQFRSKDQLYKKKIMIY